MLRNIGRFYRSTDASNIPFRGEASYDLAISGERVTQSEAGLSRPRVFTGTRVIKGRTRPWHSCAQTGLLSGALQFFSVYRRLSIYRCCQVSKLNLCSTSPYFRYFLHWKTVVFPIFSDKSRIAPITQLYSWRIHVHIIHCTHHLLISQLNLLPKCCVVNVTSKQHAKGDQSYNKIVSLMSSQQGSD